MSLNAFQVFYDTASTTCSSESDAARTSRLSRSRSLESSRAHLPLRYFKITRSGGLYCKTLKSADQIETSFKKYAKPGLFYGLCLVFSNKHHYNFYIKYMWKMSIQYMVPGTDPIKILQSQFYTTLFFKHFDWLKIYRIQSECLKNCVAWNLRCKILIGPAPGFKPMTFGTWVYSHSH